MALNDFLLEWFWNPIVKYEGYNVVNTTAYALVFVLFAGLLFKVLEGMKMKFDRKFLFALLVWVFSVASLRVVEDVAEAGGAVRNVWLVTPGIFVLGFALAFCSLALSVFLENKIGADRMILWGSFGLLFGLPNLASLPVGNFAGLAQASAIMLFWLAFVSAWRKISPKFMGFWNSSAILAHLWDATATFLGVGYYGLTELHVLPHALISASGPWVMFPLKLAVVPIVLYYIDRWSESENEKNYIKTLIIMLGFGTGTRDLLEILAV